MQQFGRCVHSWMCPPVLRHICGPCRGRAQTQPFGDPPMWQKQVKCDFLAQTHLLSGRERRWAIFMRSADCYACMHETVLQRSVRDIMYHVVSHVRYSPDRGWRSVNYSSLLIFICSVCFVVDYTFYVRFVWKPVAATEKKGNCNFSQFWLFPCNYEFTSCNADFSSQKCLL